MPSTELTSEQAFQISQAYYELAVKIGNYRYAKWDDMTPEERQKLGSYENSLLRQSSDFNQKSVVLLLTAPKTQIAVKNITETTKELTKAVKTLKSINKILGIAAAAFTLGGAIISGNPKAILDAIDEAITAINA